MDQARSPPGAADGHGVLRIVVLAAAYFVAGRLALLLAADPGFAVSIWPAAGIALAALLLYGYGLWPGVFLGSFFVSVVTAFDATSTEAFLRSLLVPVSIASGAALQAFVGAWLIRRFAGFPSRLDRPGNLLLAMAAGGPISCLISASCAVLSLALVGRLASGEMLSSGFTWWIGNCLGAILLLPLASEWRREMSTATVRARLRVGVPILLAVVVTVVGFLTVRASEVERAEGEFERRAEAMVGTLEKTLESNFEVVRGLANALAVMKDVSLEQFRAIVRPALDRHLDLQALEWSPVVAHEDLVAFEVAARAAGFDGFCVKEPGVDGAFGPVTQRDHHVVVYYIEPYAGNEKALGYDLTSDPSRSVALRAVVDTGGIAATPPIRLVQEHEEQQGFLLFAPVFSRDRLNQRPPPPGTQPDSYAMGVFRAGDMLAASLATFDGEGIGYRVVDTTKRDAPQVLLAGLTEAELAADHVPASRWSEDLNVAGRRWTVSFRPTAAYGAGLLWGRAWLALAGGLLCTSLLGVYLLVQAGRSAATARTNEELRLRMDERRRAEAALGASEDQYRTLVRNLPGAVYRCSPDDDWAVHFISDEMTTISGYSVEKFRGKDGWTYTKIIHPDDLAYVRRTVAAAVDAGEPFVCEYRIVTADGQVRWVYEKGQAICAADGTPKWLDGVIVDVTQHRQAEEALRESEAMLAEAQRIGRMGSWEYDVPGDRLMWSDETYRLLDVDRSAFAPDFASFLERVHPEDRAVVRDCLEAAIHRDEPYQLEHRVQRKNGTVIHLRSAAEIQRDGEGRPLRLVGTLQDITQRVEMQSEQRRLAARVQEAQKLESLGVLAGGIAHDFNNILTSVLGHAELALEELPHGAPLRDRLHGIEVATRRAADLCQQMLAYSGRGQFVIETLDLRRVVRETSHMLRVSVAKDVELRYEFAADLPCIRADATQIRQVVLNLITNASEALEDKPGVITLRTGTVVCDEACLRVCNGAPDRPSGTKAFLEVEDTGCGMSREVLARLFEPFFTTKFTGRGLGMAALLGIVRGHQGGVRVTTAEGKGTRIRVCFPATAEDAQVPAAERDAPAPECACGTILLVDDEPGVRKIAESMLQALGYGVICVADGEEALECFREQREQIVGVLLDLTMPGMGGKETFHQLRRIDPDVRVILSSGYSGASVMSDADGAGFACFIQKPYRLAALRDALRVALAQTESSADHSGTPQAAQ